MISWEKRVIVANETIVAQSCNKMPSLDNCEKHEEYIEHLAKHRDEISSAESRAIARALDVCKASLGSCKPLTLTEIALVGRACGEESK